MYEVEIESREYTQEEFLKYQMWRLMPVINVDKCKDIPCDYPGLMGVPITFEDKRNPEQFELIAMCSPNVDGIAKYRRLIVLNKKPENTGKYRVTVTYETKEQDTATPITG